MANESASGPLGSLSRFSHYVLLKRLPGGGAVESYLATSQHLQGVAQVLLRRVARGALGSDDVVATLLAEAEMGAGLRHPNIAGVVDFGEAGGFCYIASEELEGITLQQLLRRVGELERRIPPALAVDMAMKIAAALAYAASPERGDQAVAHRDLGPSVVLLGGRGELMVRDLGGSQLLSALAATHAGTVLRRFVYHAPECRDGRAADTRSNVFSLAVCLYEMLTGANPFLRANPMEVLEAIAKHEPPPLSRALPELRFLDGVITCALAKQPQARYRDAIEMLADLRSACGAKHLPGEGVGLVHFVRQAMQAKVGEEWRRAAAPGDTATTEAAAAIPAHEKTELFAQPPRPQQQRARSNAWLYLMTWAVSAGLTIGLGLHSRRARGGDTQSAMPPQAVAPFGGPPQALPVPDPVRETPSPMPPEATPSIVETGPLVDKARPHKVAARELTPPAYGTLRITTVPRLPVLLEGKAAGPPLRLEAASGVVSIGSAAHALAVTLRYRIANQKLTFDLSSEPLAVVFDDEGVALGRTPLSDVPGRRAKGLRLVDPQHQREITLSLKYLP